MTEEKILESFSVVISNGKIISIGDFHDPDFPAGTVVIDAAGKYLIPGFGDMHVHLDMRSKGQCF
jgi:imidazolonepropionase-like amidohydrolase